MEECKISVIMPIHNSMKYLKQCIDSACNQTLKEIEIICVCGSGNDGSDELVEEYQKKDKRILIIKDKNGSYGHKLNVATKVARGKYIALLESDDYFSYNMLELLYEKAKEYDVDYVDADYYEFFTLENLEYRLVHKKYKSSMDYDRVLYDEEAKLSAYLSDLTANWTAIYKKSFLVNNNLEYHEIPGASYQDLGFRFLTSVYAKSAYHLSIPLYNYRIDNEGSSVKDMKKVFAVQKEYNFVKEQLKSNDIREKIDWDFFYVWKYRDYFWNAQRLVSDIRDEFVHVYKEELQEDTRQGNITSRVVTEERKKYLTLPIENEKLFDQCIESEFQQSSARLQSLQIFVQSIEREKIVVCGSGIRGKQVLDLIGKEKILCYCDKNKNLHGSDVETIPILSYEMGIGKYPEATYVITSKYYANEIKETLIDKGISEKKIVIYGIVAD